MNCQDNEVQLNPFAFPSETDARFLLLIVAIAGSTLALTEGFIEGTKLQDYSLAFIAAIGVTLFVFVRAWTLARKDAKNRIRSRSWKRFPPPDRDPLKAASLKHMDRYIQQIVEQLPGVKASSPEFVWDDSSEGCDLPSGMAFGFGRHKYVCLRQGLHKAFIKLPKSEKFHATVLHELGHLENRDVSKTIFSIALGHSFFPIALIILSLFDTYVLWTAIEKIIFGGSFNPILPGAKAVVEINVKAILLILLVEIIRSSVLRVREYYADVRARVWLGKPDPFFDLFKEKSANKKEESPIKINLKLQDLKVSWNLLRQKFQTYLAPLHPSNRQRISTLSNLHLLFKPSYEVAFFSGLLSGLGLNSSFFMSMALNELGKGLFSVISQESERSQNYTILIGLVAIGIGIILFSLAFIVALLVILGVVPIAATIGLQIQAATFADKAAVSKKRYVTLAKLAILSFLLGTGFVLGCMLLPVASTFSFVGVSLMMLPVCVGLWGSTFLIWMLPLSWIANSLYTGHLGDRSPQIKRRFLTVLSILALLPTFVSTSIAHLTLNVRIVNPDLVPTEGLEFRLISIGLFALLTQSIIWGIGWLVLLRQGWLKNDRCPNCHLPIFQPISVNQTCHQCQSPLIAWAQLPSPISLPLLPTLSDTAMRSPPPL